MQNRGIPVAKLRPLLVIAIVLIFLAPPGPSTTIRGADDDQSFLSASCQIIEGEGLEAEHTCTHSSDNIRHIVVTSGEGGTLGMGPLIDPTRQYIDVIYTFETGSFGFLTELRVTYEARLGRTQDTSCTFRIRRNNGAWDVIAFIGGYEQIQTWTETSNPANYVAADGKVHLKFYVSTDILGSSILTDYLQVRLLRLTPSGAKSTGANFTAGSSAEGTSYSDTWYYDEVCHVCQTDTGGNLTVRYTFPISYYPEFIQSVIIRGRFKTSPGYSGSVALYLHNHRLDLWQQVQVWSASTAFRTFEVQHARHTPDFVNGTGGERIEVRWVLSGQSAQLSIDYLRVTGYASDIQRFAVVIVGASVSDSNRLQYVNTSDFVYQQLCQLGFTDENIRYLDPAGPDANRHVDDQTNRTHIFETLAWWKNTECDGNDIFLVYMIDHGSYPWPGHDWAWFVIDDNHDGDTTDQEDHVFDWEVQNWLSQRSALGRLVVVLDFCKVGMWLNDLSTPALSDIVITAAKDDELSYGYGPNYPHGPIAVFSWHFFGNLTLHCIGDAFNNAAQATSAFVWSTGNQQTPQYWDGVCASTTPSVTNATLYLFSLVP